MDAIYLNQLMDLSVSYNVNGAELQRNVLAGKKDEYGKMWLLVETSGNGQESSQQWVQLSFFQMWLDQVSIAA